jgi:putative ABC transport system substrate-binding protein
LAAAPKRLGILDLGNRDEVLAGFASSAAKLFAALGWVEGRTIEFIWRFCEGDMSRIPALAKELVDARPDVIDTTGTAATRALQRATRTIPIFASVGDPVGAGFAQSLARPGGNITGFSQGLREIAQKQVELLRAAVPRLSTLAIVGAHPSLAYLREIGEPVASAARGVGVSTELRQISSLKSLEAALRALPSAGKGAVLFLRDLGDLDEGSVMRLAIRLRVPALVGDRDRVEKGGLLSYTLYREDEARREVAILDKLLRGADPAVMPFELPTKSHFAVNRATAAAIGVKLPPDFLLRADEILG